ncbi:FYVE zinc finger-domain-containing protein [Mycena floridula]|nr:FYVE zinc finger-domain-containing protein [Mycena floridula]
MSALTLALATNPVPSIEQPAPVVVEDDADVEVYTSSPQSAYSDLAVDLNVPSAALSLVVPPNTRVNEHLAVLMPKPLWKSDSAAHVCDNFFCAKEFSLFERRHHCRKCGGVFCHSCSSQLLPLLDTSKLPFLHPPRNVPLTQFESASSPLILSRVCDDCWDQIHGCPSTPRTPDLVPQSPVSMFERSLSLFTDSGNSSISSGPSTPPNEPSMLRKRHSLKTQTSVSSLRSSASHPPRRSRTPRMTLPDSERSYGELDAYPLKRASVLCKATGGGRWEPKPLPVLVGYRVPVPGGKAPYELQLEREAEIEKLRRENPVIRDGDFQYRFPRDPEPVLGSRSFQLSTF